MVNRVTLIGNLGRDPEVRRLDNGAVVAKFSIATSESYRDSSGEWQEQTEWHEIVVWRERAERAESTLKKGMLIFLEGKLTHRKYQDKVGNDRYRTEVVGNYFRIVNKRDGSGGSGGSSTYFPSSGDEPGKGASNTTANVGPSTVAEPSADQPAEDDLPF